MDKLKNGHSNFHTAFLLERAVFEKDTLSKLCQLNPQIVVHTPPEIVKKLSIDYTTKRFCLIY